MGRRSWASRRSGDRRSISEPTGDDGRDDTVDWFHPYLEFLDQGGAEVPWADRRVGTFTALPEEDAILWQTYVGDNTDLLALMPELGAVWRLHMTVDLDQELYARTTWTNELTVQGIEILDFEGEDIGLATTASDPRPTVTLDSVAKEDVRLFGNVAVVKVSGTVHDPIADVTDDPAGRAVKVYVEDVEVPVTLVPDSRPSDLLRRPFPYEGRFETLRGLAADLEIGAPSRSTATR